jgi:5'(3')-deoxyribonucleotidase
MEISALFFDMDGVLCDFVGGALKAHNAWLDPADIQWDFMNQIGFCGGGDPGFWKPLENPAFWAELEPLPDGMDLFFRAASRWGDRIGILSSGLCPGSCDGKRAWLKRWLPGYEKRAVFCTVKELCAAPCKVLIDDHEPNVNSFRWDGGGRSLLIPRPWNFRKPQTCKAGRFDVDAIAAELLTLIAM